MIKRGDRVKVDFISESRTEFSGKRFIGEGVIDRIFDFDVTVQIAYVCWCKGDNTKVLDL